MEVFGRAKFVSFEFIDLLHWFFMTVFTLAESIVAKCSIEPPFFDVDKLTGSILIVGQAITWVVLFDFDVFLVSWDIVTTLSNIAETYLSFF